MARQKNAGSRRVTDRSRRAPSITSSAVSSVVSSAYPSRAPSPGPPRVPFRFFDLPAELRLRIFEMVLHVRDPLDLDSMNYRLILPRLAMFLVSKRMHDEAYRVFYSQVIRLFPMAQSRFYHTKRVLVARLPKHYREAIHTMELRIGPGWSKPPKCQCIHPGMGLAECVNLRTLKIFVELDPSESIFTGFRGKNATEETYKRWCVDLLQALLDEVPNIETIELDAFSSVKKDSPLVLALRRKIEERQLRLIWGPQRQWEKDADEPDFVGLEKAMSGMTLTSMAVIHVQG